MELKPLSPACTDAIVFLSQISSIDLLSPLCLSTPRSLCFSFSISYLIQLTPRSPAGPWNGLLPFPSSFSLSLRLSLLEIRCSLCTHWRKHRLAQMHAKSINVDGTRLSLVMQVYWWTQTLVIFISLCLCLYISVSVFLSFFPPKHSWISAEVHSCMRFYLCYCNHVCHCEDNSSEMTRHKIISFASTVLHKCKVNCTLSEVNSLFTRTSKSKSSISLYRLEVYGLLRRRQALWD